MSVCLCRLVRSVRVLEGPYISSILCHSLDSQPSRGYLRKVSFCLILTITDLVFNSHYYSTLCLFLDLSNLCLLGLTQFGYLFLFSGLEYSLTFLVHQRFDYTRYIAAYVGI